MVWLIYSFRAIEKILPALKGKPKWTWVAPGLLCFVVLVSAIGVGIYTDGYGIHPPTQYQGHCPAPATIRNSNCVLINIQTITVSGTVTTTKQTEQAGVINAAVTTVTTTRTVTH